MDRTIGIRALNYLRLVHTPSYVGLRLLLKNSAFTRSDIAISTLVEESAISRPNRIFEVRRFKKTDENGTAHFRDYSIPSPTQALAEAYAIFHLTRAGILKRQPNVYSYRPAPDYLYPRNYEHFGTGYAERNEAVGSALKDGRVALIFDMKDCYPSVKGASTVSRLLDQISSTNDLTARQRRVIEHCATACISETGGLKIGPDLSHFLADSALQRLDHGASGMFNEYFRYVDDVVIVCDLADVERSTDLMQSICNEAGFQLNSDKTTIASPNAWNGFRNQFSAQDGSFDPLSALKFRIKLFLSRHPSEIHSLAARLQSEGIFLPLAAFQQAVTAFTWRESIRYFWQRKWGVLLRHWLDSLDSIVAAAVDCQGVLRSQAVELLSQPIAKHKLSRRWQVQHARFVINRAMYFLSNDELSWLLDFSAQQPELAETSAVLIALSKNDYSMIMAMPGPAASAAAQLSATRGAKPELNFLPIAQPDVAAEVLAQFAVRGFDVPAVELAGCSDDAFRLKRFSTGDAYGAPASPKWSYGGEIEALGVSTTSEQRALLAASRMFESEGVMLDALALSSAYGS